MDPPRSPGTRSWRHLGQRLLAGWLGLAAPLLAAVTMTPLATNLPTVPRSVTGHGVSADAVFSADGRWLFFASSVPDLVTNPPAFWGLATYRRNLETGATVRLLPEADDIYVPLSASADGNRVLLLTDASNLVSNTPSRWPQLVLLSINPGWVMPVSFLSISTNDPRSISHGTAPYGVMTPDGRWIAFESTAENLVAGDTNRIQDVFLLDTQTGLRQRLSNEDPLTLLSNPSVEGISNDGSVVLYSANYYGGLGVTNGIQETDLVVVRLPGLTTTRLKVPAIRNLTRGSMPIVSATLSTDGRAVIGRIGTSLATGADRPNGAGPGAVVYWDLTGDQATVIEPGLKLGPTTAADFGAIAGSSFDPAITEDGGAVLFYKFDPANVLGAQELQWWSAATGVRRLDELVVSGAVAPAAPLPLWPRDAQFEPDGKSILFTAALSNSPTAPRGLFRRVLSSGLTTALVRSSGGEPMAVDIQAVAMSPDGRHLSISTETSTVVKPDRNRSTDLFLVSNVNARLVPVGAPLELAGPDLSSEGSRFGRNGLSADGRWTAFVSRADTLVTNDSNSWFDVFLHDGTTGKITLASVDTNGFAAAGGSSMPVLAADGNALVFTSVADGLASGTNNTQPHLYHRDLVTGTTRRITRRHDSANATDFGGWQPALSADGRFVAYLSNASKLVSDPARASVNRVSVYVYDGLSGENRWLSQTGNGSAIFSGPEISADGSTVAFLAGGSQLPSVLIYAGFSNSPTRVIPSAGLVLAMSADGRRVAYGARQAIWIASTLDAERPLEVYRDEQAMAITDLQFSGNGRQLLAGVDLPEDFRFTIHRTLALSIFGGLSELLAETARPAGTIPRSRWPVVSVDGRFVAEADDEQWILRDRHLGVSNSVVEISRSERAAASISADGRTLVLDTTRNPSLASHNRQTDVYRAVVTDPVVPEDADADGLPDIWERIHFHSLRARPADDDDGDGQSNLAEYMAGTSPVVAPAQLYVGRRVEGSMARLQLDLTTRSITDVRVSTRRDLDASWQPIGSRLIGPGSTVGWDYPIEPSAEAEFFKFDLEP